jgi:hypothetical protein
VRAESSAQGPWKPEVKGGRNWESGSDAFYGFPLRPHSYTRTCAPTYNSVAAKSCEKLRQLSLFLFQISDRSLLCWDTMNEKKKWFTVNDSWELFNSFVNGREWTGKIHSQWKLEWDMQRCTSKVLSLRLTKRSLANSKGKGFSLIKKKRDAVLYNFTLRPIAPACMLAMKATGLGNLATFV